MYKVLLFGIFSIMISSCSFSASNEDISNIGAEHVEFDGAGGGGIPDTQQGER